MAQTVKAIAEAEAYPGPSLIIAYAPCINHGIKKGMAKAQTEEELAVKCGYWHNFRFNPAADKKFIWIPRLRQRATRFLDGEVRLQLSGNVLTRRKQQDCSLNLRQRQTRDTSICRDSLPSAYINEEK